MYVEPNRFYENLVRTCTRVHALFGLSCRLDLATAYPQWDSNPHRIWPLEFQTSGSNPTHQLERRAETRIPPTIHTYRYTETSGTIYKKKYDRNQDYCECLSTGVLLNSSTNFFLFSADVFPSSLRYCQPRDRMNISMMSKTWKRKGLSDLFIFMHTVYIHYICIQKHDHTSIVNHNWIVLQYIVQYVHTYIHTYIRRYLCSKAENESLQTSGRKEGEHLL